LDDQAFRIQRKNQAETIFQRKAGPGSHHDKDQGETAGGEAFNFAEKRQATAGSQNGVGGRAEERAERFIDNGREPGELRGTARQGVGSWKSALGKSHSPDSFVFLFFVLFFVLFLFLFLFLVLFFVLFLFLFLFLFLVLSLFFPFHDTGSNPPIFPAFSPRATQPPEVKKTGSEELGF